MTALASQKGKNAPWHVAVLDACVLYPASLRDFLMWLAVGILYAPRLTEQIHDEWTRNVRKDYPDLSAEKIVRTRLLMNRVAPDVLVTGYESQIGTLSLPDPGDRHILAAAIVGKADLIVTFNLKHFPAAARAPHGVEAISPDVFAVNLYRAAPADFLRAVHMHRSSLTKPPKATDEYLAGLTRSHLPKTCAALTKPLSER